MPESITATSPITTTSPITATSTFTSTPRFAALSTTVSTAADIRELVIVAARAADDKKADDVIILDVGETLAITDAFLIASAGNSRLVATIADTIEAAVKAAGGPGPIATEGLEEASWVLLDFGGFVVHVFLDETRRYYDLERLWADAPKIEWRDNSRPAPPVVSAVPQFS